MAASSGEFASCSGYGRNFRQHSRPRSSNAIKALRSTRHETGTPGQYWRAWNAKTTTARPAIQAARRHRWRAEGRLRASMMAATGKPQESSGVAGDDGAAGRVSVVCSAPERFQASSSATVAITRPRPPGRRCTGSARSCSQICAVRSPTPRYAAISFHEESSPSGNSTNSIRMLAHGAAAGINPGGRFLRLAALYCACAPSWTREK